MPAERLEASHRGASALDRCAAPRLCFFGTLVERAMGIEPTRAAPPGLENKRFVAIADAKCD